MSEIATLKRMAASDEYSATETAIFDGAANELAHLKRIEEVALLLVVMSVSRFPSEGFQCNNCLFGFGATRPEVPHSESCWVGRLQAVLK